LQLLLPQLQHVLQQQQQQQQQQLVHAGASSAPAPNHDASAANPARQTSNEPPVQPWFASHKPIARKPARKRKHAAAVQDACLKAPQPAAAGSAAGTITAAGSAVSTAAGEGLVTGSLSPAQQACPPACMRHAWCNPRSPPPPPTGQGSVAALLGASSSAQAAAQLHDMSRAQLFSFAAQVLA
jgi:hypothetical protein